MMSLLFAIWSIIVCYMKTGVYLKWTLWEKIGSPFLPFEIEPTRYWTSWDEKWDEDDQTDNNKPETINGWNETPAWEKTAAFNDDHLNLEDPNLDGWNAEEWDQLQQNPTWLETGMAVPDYIIMALAVTLALLHPYIIHHIQESNPNLTTILITTDHYTL